jgi:uncharacterized protein YegP (UPF0339 family)
VRIEVFQRVDGKWDWRAVAQNGRIVATSGGQGYRKAWEAKRGFIAAAAVIGPAFVLDSVEVVQ